MNTQTNKRYIPLGLLFGLLGSSQSFVLTMPDNSIVGHGTAQEIADSKLQTTLVFRGKDFSGTGTLFSSPMKPVHGLRIDRAISQYLNSTHQKHGSYLLYAADGTELSCEFDVAHKAIGGICWDTVTQQILTIKPQPADDL